MKKAFLIKDTSGSDTETIEEIFPKNGSKFTLEEVYKYIDCDQVQLVYLHSGDIMLVDEEGKLKNKPLNKVATIYYGNTMDHIVGKVIVCHPSMFK